MKTFKSLVILLAILLPTLMFGQKPAPVSHFNQCVDYARFNIEIMDYDCFAKGKTLIAVIKSRACNVKGYSFLWELDGKPIGRSQSVDCLVGGIATVHVIQYPSRRRISKNFPLHNNPSKNLDH